MMVRENNKEVKMSRLPRKAEDCSAWYLEVVKRAELADYAPIKGCMVIRPNGYGIWENIMAAFDPMIKAMGVRNAYFPLFIPESFLAKEKEHVEGFSPELAVVTHGGGKKLEEPLVVRPTSETIMYAMFSRWIGSWRDLPLKVNQWCNIVRWEKRTYPFLRTLEFLWQEGHTAHATFDEAHQQTMDALFAYQRFMEEFLSLPVLIGKKTESQKFAGALYTTSCELLMPDGKALQAATSHNLGQNFSKSEAFNISFHSKEKNEAQYVWQTSWGLSTRLIGALIMVHGDDSGLILPPKIAPIQAVIVPIYKQSGDRDKVVQKAESIRKILSSQFKVTVDLREEHTPGYKFYDWELKGVPLRLELGPKDLAADQVILVRRDTREKEAVAVSKLVVVIQERLDQIQDNLFVKAEELQTKNTFRTEDLGEFERIIGKRGGLVYGPWCGREECEDKIKIETKATARLIPFDQKTIGDKCLVCGQKAESEPLWARAY